MFRNHTLDEPCCTKTKVKDTMRSVFRERILSLCKKLGRYLIDTISPPPVSLTASSSQSDIQSFLNADHTSESEESKTKNPNPDSDGETCDGESNLDDSQIETLIGIIYARVSSNQQLSDEEDNDNEETNPDEGSIKGQIDELIQLAETNGIKLPYEPITDEAKTGTNFDRDGIQRVFEVAKRKEIDFLLVEKIDRIGRNAAETLYFIYILQSECNVTLLTPSGEHDINQVQGLMHTTLLSLMAEVQNEIRTAKAKKERIRGFLEQKQWNCKSPKVPLGYEQTEDGWIKPNPKETDIVRDLFSQFVACENYKQTKRYINQKYGPQTLDGHTVKTIVTSTVYIGEPKLPEEWLTDTPYENHLEEPSLNLLQEDESSHIDITDDVFEQSQEIVQEIHNTYSSSEDTQQLVDFVEEFSLFAVIEGSSPATLIHHCGEPLVKDGQRNLKGRKVHRYRCSKCEDSVDPTEYYRQWPKGEELDAIEMIQKVLDGETDLFDGW